MVQGVYGTMYYVSDMRESIEFYRQTLGIEPAHQSDDWTEYDFKGQKLCLQKTLPSESYPLNGVLILQLDDLKKRFETLKSRGLNVFGLKEIKPGSWTFHMRDHNDNEHSFYGQA